MSRAITARTAAQSIRTAALEVWLALARLELSKEWIFQGTHIPDDLQGLYAWLLSFRRSTNTTQDAAPQNRDAVHALVRELRKAGADVRAMRSRGVSEQEMAHYILVRDIKLT